MGLIVLVARPFSASRPARRAQKCNTQTMGLVGAALSWSEAVSHSALQVSADRVPFTLRADRTKGTGLMLNHTTPLASSLAFSVNGSTVAPVTPVSASATFALTEFTLPYGRHDFVVEVTGSENATEPSEATSVIHGCVVQSGIIASSSTTNVTVDDTAWRTGQITLTEGWNMLESTIENSNYIDTVSPEPLPERIADSGRSLSRLSSRLWATILKRA